MDQKNDSRYRKDHVDVLLVPPVLNPLNFDPSGSLFFVGIEALNSGLRDIGIKSLVYTPKHKLFEKQDYVNVARDIISYNPTIVGFSTWCITYPSSILISRYLKEISAEIIIIFGGPHATILDQETLEKFEFVDYILRGECDFTLPEFARELIDGNYHKGLNQIRGLTFRSSEGKIIRNEIVNVISELDTLPLINYDHSFKKSKSLLLDVGRGCPFNCTYCSTNEFFSKTYRTKTAERIIYEMNLAYQMLGIRTFEFSHDMFTLNKSFVKDFCQRLLSNNKELNNKLIWKCSARIDCVNKDLLKIMKESGCKTIFFGIESGSERIQRSIRKNLDITNVYKIAETCRNIGIDVNTSFIIGFPDETEEDIEKTLHCIAKLATQGVKTQVSELSLVPGTPLYIRYKDYLKFDGSFSNFSSCICGVDEIELIIKYPGIFSSFYFLPVRLLDRTSLHLLQNLINLLPQFRNTFFILRKNLIEDIENTQILNLFIKFIPEIKDHLNKRNPLITFLITQIKEYIVTKRPSAPHPYLYDIFAFESICAHMLARFARWKMIDNFSPVKITSESGLEIKKDFQSTPYWQNHTFFHRLESILPSRNGWKSVKNKIRKGEFHYLIIAVSDSKCKLFRISATENMFLKELSKNLDGEKGELAERLKNTPDFEKTWGKMKKLGVIKT